MTDPDKPIKNENQNSAILLIIGISGCSGSGKTTLARALRDVFNHVAFVASTSSDIAGEGHGRAREKDAEHGGDEGRKADGKKEKDKKDMVVLVHEDDFFLDEKDLPLTKTGVRNWDVPSSLNFPSLHNTLDYIRSHHGQLPPSLHSIEDHQPQRTAPHSSSREETTSFFSALHQRIFNSGLPLQRIKLVILEGFLLFSESVPMNIKREMDLKLFLKVPYLIAKERREKRGGYVTRVSSDPSDSRQEQELDGKKGDDEGDRNDNSEDAEGWWIDPPGYFEEVVWEHYIEDHSFLFKNGDVEGRFDVEVLRREGIEVYTLDPPSLQVDTQSCISDSLGSDRSVGRKVITSDAANMDDAAEAKVGREDDDGGHDESQARQGGSNGACGVNAMKEANPEQDKDETEHDQGQDMLQILDWAVTLVLDTLGRKMTTS